MIAPGTRQTETPDKPATTPTPAGGIRRWWIAVGVGVLTGIPIGWLLSYAAFLLAMLGLFFFMLFGLLVGAFMYRVAEHARPIGRWHIHCGTLIVVLSTWVVSMAVECRDFPQDVATRTVKKFKLRPSGMPPDQIRRSAERWARHYLKEAYPPGGALGYLQWKLTNDKIRVELTEVEHARTIHYHDNGAWWVTRIVLSITLMWFAVRSVVRPLSKLPEPRTTPEPGEHESTAPPVNASAS